MQNLPPPLSPLGAWGQFVCWFAVPHPSKPGKFNKFPCDWQTGAVIDAHDPRYWTSAACALAMAPQWDRGHGAGAGFVFTDADPYFFKDIDHAWNGAAWSPLAIELCSRLAGCAIEVSHSGTGLHIIGRTAKLEHGCRNTPLGLELYTSGRFVALTGINATGSCEADATAALASIAAQFFPPSAVGEWEGWTADPVPEYAGPPDDDELIRKALASAARDANAVFGGGTSAPSFADLWEARANVLAAWRPGEGGKPFGQSEADQALANMLAFWTGKNCERMARLMRRSALARDKWDTHRTYLADTILGACGFVQKVYTQSSAAPLIVPATQEVMLATAAATGRTLRDPAKEYLGPFDQLTHFDACFYDNATGLIYSLSKNTVFDRGRFDVNYGGHLFILDPTSQKTTASAWEAFTGSRVNEPLIVDGLCFRPECEPGELVRDGNRVYANSYVPHEVVAIAGDVGPFLDHLAKLFPNDNDREIILSYLASMAQNPGVKFQWWPVIQGCEGNGKTFLIAIMTYIMGQQYTHLPNVHKMAKNGAAFNKWIYRKLFIGVEEIALQHRRDFLEEFKVVITNDRIEIEGKGADQFTGDNRVNGILCTNHRDGVPITRDTRRYAVFYTPQQSAEDLIRDGMTEAYFVGPGGLLTWLRGGGYAHVAHYLRTLAVREAYDPAKLSVRAPRTSSTDEAIKTSFGTAEQEIIDACEEGRPGFAGGWVSSKSLDQLLDRIGARIPRSKRRDMMASLDYFYHPALKDGRVNDVVMMPDGGKPRLYVRRGHLALNVAEPAVIAKLYAKAQEAGADVSQAAIAFPKPTG